MLDDFNAVGVLKHSALFVILDPVLFTVSSARFILSLIYFLESIVVIISYYFVFSKCNLQDGVGFALRLVLTADPVCTTGAQFND